jgi:multidrug efflux pump subunit AcrA (membrane-fusion protein)
MNNQAKQGRHQVMRSVARLGLALVLIGVGVAVAPMPRGWLAAMTTSNTAATAEPTKPSDGASEGVTLYQSGMHPWIITAEPGNCPICGMKLEPIDPAKLTGEVTVDPVVVQNLGVRTAEVMQGPVSRTLRAAGTVAVAEPLVRDVNLRVSGWIESLAVGFVGARIEAGDVLFTVYSPELYAAQEELLLAVQRGGDATLLASAKDRLLNFGLTDAQVQRIIDANRAQRVVPILSPHGGVVLDKHANEGMRVDPGMRVFRMADLSQVWVQVAVYEDQLSFVQVGQPAEMTLPADPGRTYTGQVAFIDPTLDPATRSADVRIAFPNPEGLLKPGMFTDVRLRHTLDTPSILVPREAVIDTGQRRIAFVSMGRGRFEPRQVRVGVLADDGLLQVLEGLTPGEQVVVSGQFLLDSEARVRESLARMVLGNQAAQQATDPTTKRPATDTSALPHGAHTALDDAIRSYLASHDALTRDKLAEAQRALSQTRDALERLDDADTTQAASGSQAAMQAAAFTADNLEDFRNGFAALSQAMITLVEAVPPSSALGESVYVVHCPMVNRDWLQDAPSVRNPYATSMLTCGEVSRSIATVPKMTPDDNTPHGAGHAH